MTPLIEMSSISFAYESGKSVLENVTASLGDGELVGIVGPNGCGKSTLLKLMSGALRPVTGTVRIGGLASNALRPMQRARIVAFLPQSVNPIFSMRVSEAVGLGRFPHVGAFGTLSAHDRAVTDRCLTETETATLRDRDFLSLSGGERQRVLLASVLAQEPRALLLDEPTSSLDIHHQIEIFALLRRIRNDHRGIAVVTHDINLAARFCDRILLLGCASRGILASGCAGEVVTEPLLSRAYGAAIRVCAHPLTGTPLVTVDALAEPRQ
ncbi:MAG: ABC transporter ATP-binding protein [Candidatus Hydrogenedentes bacterium]|nr:ABC transporter ATP-binding protein [Candidatus Hydrogenedentota bacterium]